MSTRIHIVVKEAEKERFRREAARQGTSLSAWLREAAREHMADREGAALDSLEALGEFFDACDQRESGVEPDWDRYRRAME